MANLSTLLHPLHQLLQADTKWNWSPNCEEAFIASKQRLLNSKYLAHYDTQTTFGRIWTNICSQMQQWALLLLAYDDEIQYRRTCDYANADVLSRLPCNHSPSEEEQEGVFLISHVEELLVSAKDIAEETKRDPILSKVLDLTLTRWPSQFLPNPFYEKRGQLSTDQGYVLWGSRVVIPPKYRRRLLSDLHEGDPGVTRMKALARSFFWWPGLDHEIETFVAQCTPCETTLNRPPAAPLHPWL